MKKFLLLAGVFSLFTFYNLSAQDFTSTDPGMHKVLVDNESITATEVTYGPGQKTNSHTHPAAFLYAFTEGSLFVTNGDGTTETFVLKPGDSAYLAPQGPHVTVNNGKKPVKILLIELKSEPYMADKKMK